MLYMLSGIGGYRDQFFTILLGCFYLVAGIVGVLYPTHLLSSLLLLAVTVLSYRTIVRGRRIWQPKGNKKIQAFDLEKIEAGKL
jgi:hypothetical protein